MKPEETGIDANESTEAKDMTESSANPDTQAVEAQDVDADNKTISIDESEENKMAAAKKTESSAIELTHGGAVFGNRPVGDSEIEISGTMTFSGVRPIEASHLDVYSTLMGGRPIEASHLAVVDTDTMPGHRPIFASGMAVVDADSLPGHRPIAASPAYLMQGSELPNNRPIASNDADSSGKLMGYLD